jgi:hypothetical protein
MVIDRRSLLAALAGAVASLSFPGRGRAEAAAPLFISCRADAMGQSSVAIFSLAGEELFASNLPARGHDSTLRPHSPEIVVFARRPGNWAVVLDARRMAVRHTLIAAQDRHFYGHGAFSADGRLLYATENNAVTGDGIIGIYDATADYRRIGEMNSRGIGPHDIALMPDGLTLAIANGGLRTLPESGREVLNPDDIHPNLAFVDLRHDDAKAVIELAPDLSQLSIRHMAIAADRTVAFGCQYQGDENELPPLVGTFSPDGQVTMLDMPEMELAAMANYIGSLAIDRAEDVIAATSPRGNSIASFNRRTGAFLSRRAMNDVCGVSATPEAGDFLLSSGNSGVRILDPAAADLRKLASPRIQNWIWDNHLRPI